nr:2, 3-dihydroxybiphenyl 1, 2-dioxygenase [Rhodococcus sp. HA99]
MVKSLAYMGVTSPGLAEWESFGPEVLGLEARLSENEDVLQLRMDDRHHRLAIHRGERNALLYLGWDAGDEDSLGTCFEVLQRSGVTSRWGTEEECWERQVLSMVVAEDPSGIRHELVSGQKVEPKSFRPGRAISEFVTGEQGMGHVVLAVPDLKAAHGFYTDGFGFKKSDEISTFIDLVFYHCNPRHHSVALTQIPGVRGLHHLMLEVADIDDVGLAYDLCMERSIPISMTLGRHVNDQMVSFYVRSPSGFDIEYGWGAIPVGANWSVSQYDRTSIWGHKMIAKTPPGAFEAVAP